MRPEIKIGDRVRFRTDGDVAEIMKAYREFTPNLYGDEPYVVTKALEGGILRINDMFIAHQLELDICNDFFDIAVGDEVEIWSMQTITTQIVVGVTQYGFRLRICEEMGCGRLVSKETGQHGELPKDDDHWYALRIVKKAPPSEPEVSTAAKMTVLLASVLADLTGNCPNQECLDCPHVKCEVFDDDKVFKCWLDWAKKEAEK